MGRLRGRAGRPWIATGIGWCAIAIAVAGVVWAQQPEDFEIELPPRAFLTHEGCARAVEDLRRRADTGGVLGEFTMLQLDAQIDRAATLCEAGDYGEAGVLLDQARANLAPALPPGR